MAPDVNPSQPTFLGATADVPPSLPIATTPTGGAPQTVVRLQSLDGVWETCGADRLAGIHPQNIELNADQWGSKGATFELRRDPGAVYPDLGAFTPIKFEVDGTLVWSGRIIETPSRDGTEQVIAVACEGWQHHLDDDLYDHQYLRQRLADWKDCRQFYGEDFGVGSSSGFKTKGQISAGADGTILLGWPNGTILGNNEKVGVKLDLGPNNTATSVAIYVKGITGPANSVGIGSGVTLYCSGDASDYTTSSSNLLLSATLATIGTNPNVYQGTFGGGTRYRYITLWLGQNSPGVTLNGDVFLQIRQAVVATNSAYSVAASVNTTLYASDVIRDALTNGTTLLNDDQSSVATTSFSIPEYAPTGPLTVREHWNAVNGYHGYQSKIDVDRRPVFAALPSRPKYEANGDAYSAQELQDSSQNSGQDIYNKVVVTGTDPGGAPVSVTRTAGQSNGITTASGVPTFSNPSMDVNTTGWSSPMGGTLTRDTGSFGSSPASLKVVGTSGYTTDVQTTLTGTFNAGFTYILSFWMQRPTWGHSFYAQIGGTTAPILRIDDGGYYTSIGTNTLSFTPVADLVNPTLRIGVTIDPASATVPAIFLDSFSITRTAGSLPDRRGFNRAKQLQIGSTIAWDGVAAATIGDAWLAQHYSTPFRGSLNLTGPGAIRTRLNGQPVPLATLLLNTSELVYFADRVDPDTGAVGRSGRIASVSYRPETDTAAVSLDNQRNDLDALLSRLAAVQSGGQ